MCGIAGLYYIDNSPCPFDQFLDSLTHRGPDGRGVYKDDEVNLLLGHRRLKILDLSDAAAQPMPTPDRRYWITFNGEIYNFLELRKELKALGFAFHTESDTEVILAAYRAWGTECQLKFNGMWAFAIWDSSEKELFLSRDRFGVKPLFLYKHDKQFAFASELKSFLYLPNEINKESLSACLAGAPLEASEITHLTNVFRLKAGHHAIFSPKSGLRIEKYWETADHLQKVPRSFKGQVEQFKELFFDACRLRMRSDVPIGTALSGGLDSSAVFCTIAQIQNSPQERVLSSPQRSFTALYPDTPQDELLFAKQIIDFAKNPHTFCTIDQNALVQNFEKAVFQFEDIYDLPIGPWMLYREFRKQNTVISIDGHGADELFIGYQRQLQKFIRHSIFHPIRFKKMKKTLRSLYAEPSQHPEIKYSQLLIEQIKKRPLLVSLIRKLLGKKPIEAQQNHWLLNENHFTTETHPCPSLSPINQFLYDDFHTSTLPTILRNFDRCSMAHGIEVRAPFMDWRMVCYAFSLPDSAKLSEGYTKRILREAMKGIVPDPIRTRKIKIGFASPLLSWIQTGLKEFVLDRVSSRSFVQSDIWNGPFIRGLILNAYQANEYVTLRNCWEYIQADLLIEQFKSNLNRMEHAYDAV